MLVLPAAQLWEVGSGFTVSSPLRLLLASWLQIQGFIRPGKSLLADGRGLLEGELYAHGKVSVTCKETGLS